MSAPSSIDAVAAMVLEETRRFEAALPDLMTRYEGRWVVFKDGAVVSDHDTEEEAFLSSLERFGLEGGQVIAQVKPIRPRVLTAAVLFR